MIPSPWHSIHLQTRIVMFLRKSNTLDAVYARSRNWALTGRLTDQTKYPNLKPVAIVDNGGWMVNGTTLKYSPAVLAIFFLFSSSIFLHASVPSNKKTDAKAITTPAPTPMIEVRPSSIGMWEGFREIKWGDSFGNHKDMTITESKGDEKFCTRKTDRMVIGNANLSKIIYLFYKDRFCGVIVQTKTSRDFNKLRESTFEHFGPLQSLTTSQGRLSWKHPSSHKNNVVMRMEFMPDIEIGTLSMGYLPIVKQQVEDSKNKIDLN
jgi:hypothetical protein